MQESNSPRVSHHSTPPLECEIAQAAGRRWRGLWEFSLHRCFFTCSLADGKWRGMEGGDLCRTDETYSKKKKHLWRNPLRGLKNIIFSCPWMIPFVLCFLWLVLFNTSTETSEAYAQLMFLI